jgi:hypothetical protein
VWIEAIHDTDSFVPSRSREKVSMGHPDTIGWMRPSSCGTDPKWNLSANALSQHVGKSVSYQHPLKI